MLSADPMQFSTAIPGELSYRAGEVGIVMILKFTAADV
jgi:hypothetical protein